MPCIQCGTCVASCPVRTFQEGYNIRRIIKMALLGMKKQVLTDPFIWICSTCLSCYERCPQDIKPSDVMNAIRNIAVQEGIIHGMYKKILENICNHDRLYPIDEFIQDERMDLGLPRIMTDLGEGKKLARK